MAGIRSTFLVLALEVLDSQWTELIQDGFLVVDADLGMLLLGSLVDRLHQVHVRDVHTGHGRVIQLSLMNGLGRIEEDGPRHRTIAA